jgi:phosphoglycolate phosphatase-like HAD superfamily hydrolase
MPAGVELLNPALPRHPFKAAVFDFDGTVSLIREGWAGVMADLGLEILQDNKLLRDTDSAERLYLEDQMLRLSGKPSIFQMRRMAEIVAERGGTPPDPEAMLAEFLRRLFAVADRRKEDLRTGKVKPAEWAVPGTHALLDELRRRGVELYLASGTDLKYVREEAALLDLPRYFGARVFAPADNTPDFSKRTVIAGILRDHGIGGAELIGFGDGYSETVEVKRAGGVAVGVASQEAGVPGLNALKRAMLAELGADVIVPDYGQPAALVAWLFGEG